MKRGRPTIRCLAVWLGLCLALTPAAAQTGAQGAELHQTYDLSPGGSISVSNVSGYIRVTSWNENRVRIDAVKRGRRGEDLSMVEIQVSARPDRIEVRTLYPRLRSSSISVDYDIKVPRTSLLNSLDSTSGEVSVTGPVARVVATSTSGEVSAREVQGDANLRSTSGEVAAGRVGGMLTASSTSGNLRLERVAGRVVARATSGGVTVIDAGGEVTAESTSDTVTIENVRGRVVATTISGGIIVRRAEDGVRARSVSGTIELAAVKGRIEASSTSGAIALQNVESRDIQAKSHSGGVRFQGRLFGDGSYSFESFSSDIVLQLPADSGFNLTARTFSGGIETDFPIQLAAGTPLGRGRSFTGTAGGGGAQLTATGFSGSIHIKKAAAQK